MGPDYPPQPRPGEDISRAFWNVSGVEVYSHEFAALAAQWPDTAAGRGVPIVLLDDVVAGDLTNPTNHHRDFFSLYVTRRGHGTHTIETSAYAVVRGDVYVMAPGMAHHFAEGDSLVFDTAHFQATVFDEATRDILARTPGFQALVLAGDGEAAGRWLHLTPGAFARVADAFDELRSEWRRGTEESALLVRALFLRLLVLLARERARIAPEPSRAGAREATVAAALRFMDEGFAGPLRIEQVAAAVFLSPDRFTEVFAAATGRTPRDYLRHLRVEKALSLLRATDATVAAIAAETGFSDASHLARAVRAATGQPPGAHRGVG